MNASQHTFTARLWQYPGEAATWYFLTIPKALGAQLRADNTRPVRGFGSLPVTATIGSTSWQTSLFPDRQSGSYFLPIKLAVRRAEALEVGDEITSTITVRR